MARGVTLAPHIKQRLIQLPGAVHVVDEERAVIILFVITNF